MYIYVCEDLMHHFVTRLASIYGGALISHYRKSLNQYNYNEFVFSIILL
jgi:hypothetical protein